VYLTVNNKLSIKSSPDLRIWQYDVREIDIHKNWIDPEMEAGEIIEIKNIQVARDDFNSDLVSILYFHNHMLFIRNFSAALLIPVYDVNGNKVNEYLRKNLSLQNNSNNKPIFLIGNIPENIRAKKIEEIDNGISLENSELFFDIPYSREEVERFDERFDVDVDTQTFAYVDISGLMRVFYKDSLGNLNVLSIDAVNNSTLEIWYSSKE
jgi:hypothetical protein